MILAAVVSWHLLLIFELPDGRQGTLPMGWKGSKAACQAEAVRLLKDLPEKLPNGTAILGAACVLPEGKES